MEHIDHNAAAFVLVADDDWMTREVLEAYLVSAGWDVMTAHTGEQALAQAQARPPDLVLLDVRLPDLNGYEVCRRLKASAATAAVPVVLVTALAGEADKQRAISAGADDVLAKPLDSAALLLRARSLVRVKRLRDALAARDRQLLRLLGADPGPLAPPEHEALAGSACTVAALAAGLRGLALRPDAPALLDQAASLVTEIAAGWGGALDGRIGGEFVALFDAPAAAAEAALTLRRACAARGLALGVGLHCASSPASAAGLARWLQALADDGEVIASEALCQRAADRVTALRLPPQSPPGGGAPLALCRLTGPA